MATQKPIKTIIKLQCPAGKAQPAPPVGTVLGPQGINIMDFCKQFNEATKDKGDTIIPCEITIYEDRTFSFILKQPPAAVLIKQALGIKVGSANPKKTKIGTLTKDQMAKIVEIKMSDLSARTPEEAAKIIAGTARSMGVDVEK
ncbi:MAG: 50S ribosomal protein L11 [bacterium]